MKRMVLSLVLLSLLLAALPAAGETAVRPAMTVMIYMCGSDLESRFSSATNDIQEMLLSGIDPDRCNVVIMAGGCASWAENSTIRAKGAGIYRITRKVHGDDLQLRSVQTIEGMNMGDPGTLSSFLTFCHDQYPSDRYALVFWDHGGGPMEGVCYDETQGKDALSLTEIQRAFRDSAFPEHGLSWIGFDACLMASLETGLICAPYADYMIASQETEPDYGWDYRFLKMISDGMPEEELVRSIVDGYATQRENRLLITLSCVDLRQIGGIREAADRMFEGMAGQLTAETFTAFSNERRDAKSFGRATALTDFDLADLYDLAEQYEELVPGEAEAVQTAIRSAVYHRGNQADAHGLSIYSPYYNKDRFAGKWQSEYDTLKISASYSNYMERYADIWLGKPLGDWSSLTYQALPVREDAQELEFILTDDQLAHFASAKLIILRETDQLTHTYAKVYESETLKPQGNALRYSYDFRMLYAVNDRGQALSDPLYFENTENNYLIPAMLENISRVNATINGLASYEQDGAADTGSRTEATVLRCHREDYALVADGYLFPEDLDQLMDRTNDAWLSFRESESMDLSAFRYLNFNYGNIGRRLGKFPDGKTAPFSQWPRVFMDSSASKYLDPWNREVSLLEAAQNVDYHAFGAVSLESSSWGLAFLKSGAEERTHLYAQFIVTDSQGNQMAGELIPLNQENVRSKAIGKTLCSDGKGNFEIIFNLLEAFRTDEDDVKLYLSFSALSSLPNLLFLPVSVEFNGVDAGVPHLEQMKTNTFFLYDDAGRPRSAILSKNYLESLGSDRIPLLADGVIHSVRLQGYVYDQDPEDDNPYKRIILGEFDRTIEVDFDLSGFMENAHKSSPITTELSMRYQIVGLDTVRPDIIEGTLAVRNMSGRTRHLEFTDEKGRWPGAFVNQWFFPDARMDFETLELAPDERKAVHFTIRIPRGAGGESFFTQWGIDQIWSIAFTIKDDLAGTYSYMDGNTYCELSTSGYERQDFVFPLSVPVPDLPEADESKAPKQVMLAENASIYISGLRQEKGTFQLDLMLRNGGAENMQTIGLLLHEYDMDFLIGDASINGTPVSVRASSVYSNPAPSRWDRFSEINHIPPHVYERCTVELRTADGTDLPEKIEQIALIFTLMKPGAEKYSNVNSCRIQLNESARPGVWSADEMEIAPSITIPELDLILPEDPARYAVTLSAELPKPLMDLYRAGSVTRAVAFIVRPEATMQDSDSYYTVYANPVADCEFRDHKIYADFPGLLLMPQGAKEPVYTEYGTEDGMPSVRINHLLIGGNLLGGQWVDHILNETWYRMDLSARTVSFKTCSRSCDWSAEPKEQRILMERMTFGLRPLSGGVNQVIYVQYHDQEQFAYQGKPPAFNFVPASDLSPMVLFAFRYTDQTGSGMLAFLVPYDEACSP